jgi:tRNA-splicing ligase RtcB
MRVPGLVFASEAMARELRSDESLRQVANVAHLPGIVGASVAMPDIHWGYGFPIGGVAAVDAEEGVVSPGGVGYDINCGVRLLASRISLSQVRPDLERLLSSLRRDVPSGVGSTGGVVLDPAEERRMLSGGMRWAVAQGYASEDDRSRVEGGGVYPGADPSVVSDAAVKRGRNQLGTLGSGNHFLEVDEVSEIFDAEAAAAMGLFPGQLVVLVHSGSRGLGYQVCDDSLDSMGPAMRRAGIEVPDRQLACAPIRSPEGERYLAALAAAANYAFVNRQILGRLATLALEEALRMGPRDLGMRLVYDVGHNNAKFETHEVEGRKARLLVHRKGATRAFPPGHPELPAEYRPIGQPVLIPGEMGSGSWVLAANEGAPAFASTAHGAGRRMSRGQAKAAARGRSIEREMAARGVLVASASRAGLAEEIPEAYKDVDAVVDVVVASGAARKVARLLPRAVLKG